MFSQKQQNYLLLIALLSLAWLLSIRPALADSGGRFPRKGVYVAWVNANILFNHALDYEKNGELDKAIQYFNNAIDTYPFDSAYYYNLGNTLLKRNDAVQAELCYQKAVEYEPGFFNAWLNLSQLLLSQGKIKEAQEACKKAEKLATTSDKKNLVNSLKEQIHTK